MDHAVGHLADQGDFLLADDLRDKAVVGRAQVFPDVTEEPQHRVPRGLGEQRQKRFLRDASELNGTISDGTGAARGTIEYAELAEIIIRTFVRDRLRCAAG